MIRITDLKGDYSQPTPTRRIWSGTLGLWYSPRLMAGNSKLFPFIYIFDLLPVVTCPNHGQCEATCYAKAGNRYKTCFNSRLINTCLAFTKAGRDELYNVLGEQLARVKPRLVRLHSSGDIFSAAYASLWTALCLDHPQTRFYGYTKTQFVIGAPNCNMVQSVLPDGSLNYGNHEYLADKVAKYGYPVCDYAAEGTMHCGVNCSLCMTHDHVLFHAHGSLAKAKG